MNFFFFLLINFAFSTDIERQCKEKERAEQQYHLQAKVNIKRNKREEEPWEFDQELFWLKK